MLFATCRGKGDEKNAQQYFTLSVIYGIVLSVLAMIGIGLCSGDGVVYKQMRICHMMNGAGTIRFGIYACSPEDSSFKATFTNMALTECKWLPHDGQQADY